MNKHECPQRTLTDSIQQLTTKGTTLVVIDMQNGFLSKDAVVPVPNPTKIIRQVAHAVDLAHKFGLPIIWTQVSMDNVANSVYPKLHPEHFKTDGTPFFARASNHYLIVPSLRRRMLPSDVVIQKDRYNAFYGTNLDIVLRQRGTRILLFAGVVTNVCVESSLRTAYELDYVPVLLSDCTGTFTPELQETTISLVKMVFGYVLSLKELTTILTRSAKDNGVDIDANCTYK